MIYCIFIIKKFLDFFANTDLANVIGIFSLIIAIIAVIISIITNAKGDKRYIESLRPLLSFNLYEKNDKLLLSIRNNGKSEAKEIKIKLLKIEQNGKYNNFYNINGLENKFMLFPMEEVQHIIANVDRKIDEIVFPTVTLNISFISGNDGKISYYTRTVSVNENIYERNKLSKLEDAMTSISYSNNRLANYIEGRTLFVYDELNVMPHNSLYKDMKDAFNNNRRDNDKIENDMNSTENKN